MGSLSGTSSGASTVTQMSDEVQAFLMEERKRKRKESNRESARRSRMRKKKHLDDLTAELTQLREDNHQIIMSLNITSQRYLHVEAENSVLRAQANELSCRLLSLEHIITFLQWWTLHVSLSRIVYEISSKLIITIRLLTVRFYKVHFFFFWF